MNTVHVVVATDENYVQHAAVTLLSVFKAKTSPNPIVAYVIGDGLSEESKTGLNDIAAANSAELKFLSIKSEALNGLRVNRYISRVAYYRLDIANILPPEVNKVVYLDVDTIALEDIADLWETDISEYYLAAVKDYGVHKFDTEGDHRAVLGMRREADYFNSGVLLINVDMWRQNDVAGKVVKRTVQGGMRYHDQDGLNAILFDKWLSLDPKWNVHKAMFRKYYSLKVKNDILRPVVDAVRSPAVVHYTGPSKPWHYSCGLPYSERYWELLITTPWKAFKQTDINFKSFGKRADWLLKRKIAGLLMSYKFPSNVGG